MEDDFAANSPQNVVRNRVLVVGNLGSNSVVTSITKAKGTEPTKFQGGNLSKFLLDNKYYSAEVEFVSYEADSLENMPSLLPEFSSTVDAFILAFDTSNLNTLTTLKKSWISQWIDDHDPGILLALTNADVEAESFNDDIREWCFEQGMELVDITVQEGDQADQPSVVEDSVAFFEREERTGFERVLEAIQAHTWSHMKMKDRQAASAPTPTSEKAAPQQFRDEGLLSLMQMLAAVNLADDDDDTDEATLEKRLDSFEETLHNLRSMRDRAAGMPDGERRELAAQFALSLANMIGDDTDELGEDFEPEL